MSMGSGLYVPAMMLPPGMQHMHAPHMGPFSPIGVGMQMRLGMGMLDANVIESSRFIQVPQKQGTQLPITHTPGSSVLHGMARPNAQVFGHHPSQVHPMPMPHAPIFSFPGEPFINSSSTLGLMETVDKASSAFGLKDQIPQLVQNTNNGCNSTNQMSTQVCLLTKFSRFCKHICSLELRFSIIMIVSLFITKNVELEGYDTTLFEFAKHLIENLVSMIIFFKS